MTIKGILFDRSGTLRSSLAAQRRPLISALARTLLTLGVLAMSGVAQPHLAQAELKVRYADGFEGQRLYLPQGKGPHPCILILHGSEGGLAGWSHVGAMFLAPHGFAVMPWNYSKGGSYLRSGNILDVDLDDTEAALTWLRNNTVVACTKVGLYGASRGAEHALLLTSLLAAEKSLQVPDAVAVHASPDTIRGAFLADRVMPDSSYDGRGQYDSQYKAWRWRGGYDDVEPGTRIKIERYRGPLFLSHGEDDEAWSVNNTRRIEGLLKGAGRHPEVHYFSGQGHILDAKTKNLFHEQLIDFFKRHLSP